ncbi:MAG: calcium/sodium antiporter [Clostridia bacterium]|nr:calcium/sodium antiporter [Clostridia bacterium]
MLIGQILLLVLGIILLIKGSDFFVDAGSEIGRVLRISEVLLGITIVAFGTSLPELIIAITSSHAGSNEIALGNILGTNLFNLAVILATIALIRPVKFKKETVRRDMYMSVVTAFVFTVIVADKIICNADVNIISRSDGIILLVLFGMYMYHTIMGIVDRRHKEKEKGEEELKLRLKDIDVLTKNIAFMILGIIMIFLGANFSVSAVEKIAVIIGISETFISILIVAIGTSLPEIFTSITAIKKGKTDIAVGNLIGSNMFNVLFVLGTAATIRPITLEADSLVIDAFTFFAVTIMLMLHAINDKEHKISKAEGTLLFTIYIAYVLYVVVRG